MSFNREGRNSFRQWKVLGSIFLFAIGGGRGLLRHRSSRTHSRAFISYRIRRERFAVLLQHSPIVCACRLNAVYWIVNCVGIMLSTIELDLSYRSEKDDEVGWEADATAF